jgi:catechol 2,3-dioxygenase-like lactoylglutathione lyase family enzyme
MATVQVRYIVNDVAESIRFYVDNLGFKLDMNPNPHFAMLSLGDMRLVISPPGNMPGGGQAMPDGTKPAPGGWNRFGVPVTDLPAKIEQLKKAGAKFRNEMVKGVGVNQIILEDPSGNPIELFEPTMEVAKLGGQR